MRYLALALAAFLTISLISVGAVMAITQDQAKVIPVLKMLELELVPSKAIGGPQKFKVTKKTLDLLKKAKDEGQVIVLDNFGAIKFENAKTDAGNK